MRRNLQSTQIQLTLTGSPIQNEMRIAFADLRKKMMAVSDEERRNRERHWQELAKSRR